MKARPGGVRAGALNVVGDRIGAHARLWILTTLTMCAFAANSVLCRIALRTTSIDPATFTAVRLLSAAVVLWAITAGKRSSAGAGSWASAAALFVYAAAFSFAYVRLDAGIGALLLFGAVQLTMIGYGVLNGERHSFAQLAGMVVAAGGLALLLLSHRTAGHVSLGSSALMLAAGAAWGVYSLRGRRAQAPALATRDNFVRSLPLAAVLLLAFLPLRFDPWGVGLAMASGAVASGMGYVVWYSVVPRLSATEAATVQLCVPAIAAGAGYLLLGEELSLIQMLGAASVLGGVLLAILQGRKGTPR